MTRFRIINWWIARKLEGFHILLAAGGSLACLTGIAAEQPAVSRGGGIFLLCLAVVVLIHENLHRFWDYLENHQDLDRLPAGQMKQVNLFLLLCFLTVFLGFVFLAGFFPWKETGELLYAGIRTFFRFLASLFPKGEEEYEMGEGEAGQLLSGMEFLEGGGENDPFWEMVSYVFAAVTAVGFRLFLLYLLVRKIAEYLGSLTFDGDEKVFLKPEEIVKKESRSRRRNPFFSRFPFLSGSHSERVRRLYQKSVREALGTKRRQKEREFACMTPEQIERAAGLSGEEIHRLYEKARYSREGCSAREAEAMQEHCRKICRK